MNVQEAFERLKEEGLTESIQMVRKLLREKRIKGSCSANRKEGYIVDPNDLERYIIERKGCSLRRTRELEEEVERLSLIVKGYQDRDNDRRSRLGRFENELIEMLKIPEEILCKLIDALPYWSIIMIIVIYNQVALIREREALLFDDQEFEEIVEEFKKRLADGDLPRDEAGLQKVFEGYLEQIKTFKF